MNNTGKLGEIAAVKYLRKSHWQIADVNYRCRFGEIDIIALKKDILAFVEVKTRNENSIAQPMEFVNAAKQNKIILTAQLFMQQCPFDAQPRFDVIEVHTENNKIININHIENAFNGV